MSAADDWNSIYHSLPSPSWEELASWERWLAQDSLELCLDDTGTVMQAWVDGLFVHAWDLVVTGPSCANTSCNGNKRGDNGRCENCNGYMEDRA